MIDKRLEPYYDIMISIFLGVILILSINMLYDSPRTFVIYSVVNDNEYKQNMCSIKN